MPQKTTVQGGVRVRALLDEHRRLHEDLEAIQSALACLPAAADVPSLADALASRLRELVALLRAHFAREESEGLFEEIAEAWPNTAQVCDRLRGEHRGLLERFVQLRDETEAGLRDGAALHTFAARVLACCGELADHEERENDLLYRSLDDATAAQD